MRRTPMMLIATLAALWLLLGPGGSQALAQFADVQDPAAEVMTADQGGAGSPGAAALSADKLRALVAPVALYPDELLAIVLPAATNPLQVVGAQRFLDKQKADSSLQPDPEWDPAILALLNYPQVVKLMNDDLDWTEALGNAVLDQQKDVLSAIQTARASASDAGYLESNEQQTVVTTSETIVIQSKEPDVIYVPTYDPAPVVSNTYVNYPPPVYSDPYPGYWAPGATFLAGMFVGAAFNYGFDWNNGDIDIDNNFSRGDVNIGNGNTNIDRDNMGNRFNGDRKPGADGKMKWSSEKARQKSSMPRTKQANRPSSDKISKGLSGAAKPNTVRPPGTNSNRNAQNQSKRGNSSLGATKQPKQNLQRNATEKQQFKNRQQQRKQPLQVDSRQMKQKGGGAFQQMPARNTAKAQSSRGSRSLGGGGGGGGSRPRPSRR